MRFAKSIKPGFRANALALPLLALLKVWKPRKDIALKNIEMVFPEMSAAERNEILEKSYRNLIWTGTEFLALQRDPSAIDKWVEDVEGIAHVEEALSKGKGAIMVGAHYGNWELMAAWMAHRKPLTVIVRDSDDKFQRELIKRLRSNAGVRTLEKREPMTRIAGLLRRNELVGIVPDQHGGREGIDVPFFGMTTSTVMGPAVFAWLTGAPLIPVHFKRIAPFKFILRADRPIEWRKTKDREACIRELTEKVNRAIEEIVKDEPGLWLWQHRRFREYY